MKIALSVFVVTALLVGGWAGMKHFAPSEAQAAEGAPADSSAAEIGPIAAELDGLTERLAAAEARADSLRQLLDAQRAEADAARTGAAELAATLVKLEDDELGQVVQQLDGRSFVQLYEASTTRNQRRLLAALTPAQAAAFVRHQLPGGPERARAAARASAPDSSATP